MEKKRLDYLRDKALSQVTERSSEDLNVGVEEIIEIASEAFLSQSKGFKEIKQLIFAQNETIKILVDRIDGLEIEIIDLKERTVSPLFSVEECDFDDETEIINEEGE